MELCEGDWGSQAGRRRMPLGTCSAVGTPVRARGPKRTAPLFSLTLKLQDLVVLMVRVLWYWSWLEELEIWGVWGWDAAETTCKIN